MKISHIGVSLLVLGLMGAVSAADHVVVKASDSHNEYHMRVVKKGDHYVGYHNNHEYILRGDSSHYRVDGDYVVQGNISSDGLSFEARELQPVEYRMHVARRGDHYVGVYNNHEYILRGDAALRINAEGDYVTYGEIGTDGTYFETREVSPVTVSAPATTVVVTEPAEYRMRIVHRGDRYYGVYNNREYILRGDSVAHISADGEYIVHGSIAADGTYIETREVRPAVVVQEPAKEVIIVKERREPIIKLGPLEIGR